MIGRLGTDLRMDAPRQFGAGMGGGRADLPLLFAGGPLFDGCIEDRFQELTGFTDNLKVAV